MEISPMTTPADPEKYGEEKKSLTDDLQLYLSQRYTEKNDILIRNHEWDITINQGLANFPVPIVDDFLTVIWNGINLT